MKTINIKVTDKCPAVESMTGSAVSDNTYQFKFEFDDEWQDGTKTFLLVNPWGEYTPFVMENDEITIEIPYDGRLSVGVMQGKTATSRPCIIEFKPSIKKLMGEQIPPPPDDVYAQIMSIINTLEAAKLNPAPKTDDMTEPVGRDENGQLWAAPMGGGGGGGGSGDVWYPTVTDGVLSWAKSAAETPPEPTDIRGDNGKSAYEIAVENGFVGTEEEWLESLKGEPGDAGKSAYEIAVANGFVGTEEEWLESLVGAPGDAGKSAYEIAVANGFTGTESEWLESLVGAPGDDYVLTEADKTEIAQAAADLVDSALLGIIGEVS